MIKTLAIATLESAINHYLALDPHTINTLASLEGKVILLEITDWPFKLFLLPTKSGFTLMTNYEEKANTIIKGKLFSLIKYSATTMTTSSSFSEEVEISGDMELGENIRKILRNIDIDWEEHLSTITGDVIAHQAGNLARDFFAWGRNTAENMQHNLTEYLQEEAQQLPPKEELHDFYNSVDELRSQTERLAARIKNLS